MRGIGDTMKAVVTEKKRHRVGRTILSLLMPHLNPPHPNRIRSRNDLDIHSRRIDWILCGLAQWNMGGTTTLAECYLRT